MYRILKQKFVDQYATESYGRVLDLYNLHHFISFVCILSKVLVFFKDLFIAKAGRSNRFNLGKIGNDLKQLLAVKIKPY